jgi:putative tryptophan/tyrosine transport system substrate-binding protein
MRRREVIGLLGGATAWPFAARGQPAGAVWRIGFLTPRSRPIPPGHDAFSDAFLRGMNELGYSEQKNLTIEWRYANGQDIEGSKT